MEKPITYPSQPSVCSRFAWYLSSSCRSPRYLLLVFWVRVRIRFRTGVARLPSINVRTAARAPSAAGARVPAFFTTIHSTYNNFTGNEHDPHRSGTRSHCYRADVQANETVKTYSGSDRVYSKFAKRGEFLLFFQQVVKINSPLSEGESPSDYIEIN